MKYKNIIGLGVAGNFAGHLEQAGEAADFVAVKTDEKIQPKAIFPFYVPSEKAGFLSIYPLSSDTLSPLVVTQIIFKLNLNWPFYVISSMKIIKWLI
ncbi:hypothetical protein HMPREF1052_1685 [Pasteurella bettyae CCUG 2042]|uniref:Uncharacterized protein n=1 Tax=Pasteurella bettyae CCUG 2042 TaxID=1095749 RepID=I3DDC6_9PAST|nr:hypothetical protein HMPREF1052_1685 [Pasteurella bettyae CCUG 2042]SUB21998.1 Uncharacterised protein [Pasteurella bettyae]